jgi:NADH dehydrogenase [ubiquinone] 1 alpha subcomplex assembly factor 1
MMKITRRKSLCIVPACAIGWAGSSQTKESTMDFRTTQAVQSGRIVNDGLMGGVSQSSLRPDPEGLFFEGNVSLANNGGFASMRFPARFSQATHSLELVARGQGHRYKFTLRTEKALQVFYESDFLAEASWKSYRFKLEEFKSTYRGRFVQAPNLSFHDVSEFGILIADKQEGDFRLQIRTLTAL